MKYANSNGGITDHPTLTTEQLANALVMRPQTIRKRFCQTGSYFSVVPAKLANGQLRWPANAIQLLMAGGVQ